MPRPTDINMEYVAGSITVDQTVACWFINFIPEIGDLNYLVWTKIIGASEVLDDDNDAIVLNPAAPIAGFIYNPGDVVTFPPITCRCY